MRLSILVNNSQKTTFTELAICEAVGIVRKNQCCRRAFTLGVLFGGGSLRGEDDVSIKVRTDGLSELMCKLVREQFGRDAVVNVSNSTKQTYTHSFISSTAASMMNDPDAAYDATMKCTACKQAFLCGILCSCTSINDPKKDYYLSIRISPEYKHAVGDALLESGIEPSYRVMGKKGVYYMRASSAIEDFLAVCGMQKLLFDFINLKIENEYRNNANRASNIEINNIKKTIDSSKKYKSAIEWLETNGAMGMLDSELYETARLRVEYPEYSLAALGSMMSPAVSKSGVLHRLNRIYDLYEQAKNKAN